jgi:hypothetical protein
MRAVQHIRPLWGLWGLVLGLHCSPPPALGQTVTRHPRPEAALEDRWAWAVEQGQRSGTGFWVGYQITRTTEENSFVGNWIVVENSYLVVRHPTLEELVYDRRTPDRQEPDGGEAAVRREAERALNRLEHHREPPRKVQRETAILFHFAPRQGTPKEVCPSDLNLHVELDGQPLLWLEAADDTASLALLRRLYADVAGDDLRENLLGAIALHDDRRQALSFLRAVLAGRDGAGVRAQAAFWISQVDDPADVSLLVQTARDDRSEKVREQAVFALSQMHHDTATDGLIDLARHEPDTGVRKQAIFWLGQQASEKALGTLRGLLEDEGTNLEVQKQALFALTQQDDRAATPLLIDVARTHASRHLRKEAIFWLSQQDDPRALEALIALAKGQ